MVVNQPVLDTFYTLIVQRNYSRIFHSDTLIKAVYKTFSQNTETYILKEATDYDCKK